MTEPDWHRSRELLRWATITRRMATKPGDHFHRSADALDRRAKKVAGDAGLTPQQESS